MSKKLQFVWIDDENRGQAFKTMKARLGVGGKFINVGKSNVNYLKDIATIKPDLIIVDHNLTNSDENIKKGSTIASLIREKHPEMAIICVTGQDPSKIDNLEGLSYEAVFEIDQLGKHYESILSIAKSFKKLNSDRPINIDEFIALLKAPKIERIKLENIIPMEIKENFEDKALFQNISHWITHILITRPGFLYNRLWSATYLGLTEKGFKKVEDMFEKAKYKGLFADQTKERWWKSSLIEILSKEIKTTGLPWEKGRSLSGITHHDYSKDYYTDNKEDLPEVVAYTDETCTEEYPMKKKYTVPHPKFDKLLYFEEIGMMKID